MKTTALSLGLSLITLWCAALPAQAADATLSVVAKMAGYHQTGAGTVVPQPGTNATEFNCFAEMAAQNSLLSGSVRTPSPPNQTYPLTPDGSQLDYSASFSSQINLDAAFPNGTYTLILNTARDGNRSFTLSLTGNSYPATPQLSNYDAAQNINPTAAFDLTWNAWPGGTTNDIMDLEIEDSQGNFFYGSPGPGEPGGLTGVSTAFTIPAGVLTVGQTYHCFLTFFHPVAMDVTTYPGATAVAGYGKFTEFTIAAASTTGEPDARFVIVSKALHFQQLTATNIALRTSNDAAGFDTFIVPTAPNLVASATVRTPLNATNTLLYSGDTGGLEFQADFASQAQLDSAYPNGAYVVDLNAVNDGPRAISLNLAGDLYPNAPRLLNFTPAQAIDSTQPFTLRWNTFTNGTVNDVVMFHIEDPLNYQEVFASPMPGSPDSLNGTSNSFTLPAGTLMAGRSYTLHLDFNRLVSVNTNAYPGVMAAALYTKVTAIPISTFGEPDNSPPWLNQTAPEYHETGVSLSSGVAFQFNEPMQNTSSIIWNMPQAITWQYTWSSDRTTLFCHPATGLLPANITISWMLNPASDIGFQDLAGNALPNMQGQFTTGSQTSSPDVQQWLMYKLASYQQTSATTVALTTNDPPYEFGAVVQSGAAATITAASFTGPGSLPLEFHGESWENSARFANPSQLDAAFPNGTYTFNVQAFHDGARTLPINMPAGSYPAAPRISNYAAAQAINPASAFAVSWDAFAGATTNDVIVVNIWCNLSNDDIDVFNTPDYGQPGSLNGTATSVQIPANTLPAGRSLRVEVLFIKVLQTDSTTYPGAVGSAVYAAYTQFTAATTGAPRQPVMSSPALLNNHFQFTVTGEPNFPYRMEYSENLQQWNHLHGDRSASGILQITDWQPPGPRRFYRVLEGW